MILKSQRGRDIGLACFADLYAAKAISQAALPSYPEIMGVLSSDTQ